MIYLIHQEVKTVFLINESKAVGLNKELPMDNLQQQFDFEAFPLLKSSLELDELTVEDLLKRFSHKTSFYYLKAKQGWFEQFSYAGLILTVLVHGKSKRFAWEDVGKWRFYSDVKKLSDPDFEVWMKNDDLHTGKEG